MAHKKLKEKLGYQVRCASVRVWQWARIILGEKLPPSKMDESVVKRRVECTASHLRWWAHRVGTIV
jgi:hypothetical protein